MIDFTISSVMLCSHELCYSSILYKIYPGALMLYERVCSEAYMANQVAYEVIEIMEDDDSVGEECWDLLEVRVAIYSSNFFFCRYFLHCRFPIMLFNNFGISFCYLLLNTILFFLVFVLVKKKTSIGVSSVIAIYIVYPLIMCLDFNVLFSCFVSF